MLEESESESEMEMEMERRPGREVKRGVCRSFGERSEWSERVGWWKKDFNRVGLRWWRWEVVVCAVM